MVSSTPPKTYRIADSDAVDPRRPEELPVSRSGSRFAVTDLRGLGRLLSAPVRSGPSALFTALRRTCAGNMDTPHSVEEVMTCPVVAVRPGVAVEEIVRQLVGRRIGAVPVVDAALRVLGVVAEADVLTVGRPRRAVARDVMSAPALTITADTSVGVARALLATHRVGRLPVVDHQGRLVGIVCRRDLLAADLAGYASAEAVARNAEPRDGADAA